MALYACSCIDSKEYTALNFIPLTRTLSIFSCSFPGADDNSLYQKFERQHKNHTHFRSPTMKLKDPQFTILHYASEVTYSIQVWSYTVYTPRQHLRCRGLMFDSRG